MRTLVLAVSMVAAASCAHQARQTVAESTRWSATVAHSEDLDHALDRALAEKSPSTCQDGEQPGGMPVTLGVAP